MTTDTAHASSPRRLLTCLGFTVCWLGAAVTGFQATVGENPAPAVRVEQARAERVDSTSCVGCASAEITAPQAHGRGRDVAEHWR